MSKFKKIKAILKRFWRWIFPNGRWVRCSICGGHGIRDVGILECVPEECDGCNMGSVWEYKKSKAHALYPGGPFVKG